MEKVEIMQESLIPNPDSSGELENVSTSPEVVEEVVAVETESADAIAARTVMAEVLKEKDNLDQIVENASPKELVVLLDAINHEEDLRDLVSIARNVQKCFENFHKENHPDLDSALYSRFNMIWARWNKKRSAYIEKIKTERETNTKKKFELLDQLKNIVLAEKVTAISEVREIQKQWKETGFVDKKDFNTLNTTYKHFLDLFYTNRSMHNELVDMDRKHNLDDKQKVLTEL